MVVWDFSTSTVSLVVFHQEVIGILMNKSVVVGWIFFSPSQEVSLKIPARNCFFSGIILDIQGVKSDETVNPKNVRSPNFSQRS